MKKLLIVFIVIGSIIGIASVGYGFYYAIKTIENLIVGFVGIVDQGNNSENKPIEPPIIVPDKPSDEILIPTLSSIKNNYDANNLGVDIDSANNYLSQLPLENDSKSYFIQINEK